MYKGLSACTCKISKEIAKSIGSWQNEGSFDEAIYIDSERSNITVNSERFNLQGNFCDGKGKRKRSDLEQQWGVRFIISRGKFGWWKYGDNSCG